MGKVYDRLRCKQGKKPEFGESLRVEILSCVGGEDYTLDLDSVDGEHTSGDRDSRDFAQDGDGLGECSASYHNDDDGGDDDDDDCDDEYFPSLGNWSGRSLSPTRL